MGLKDDLDESSFSASSELGIDNVGINIDKYLDEIERTLKDKSRSVPSSSRGFSPSTMESKIFPSSSGRGDSTYCKYSPDPTPSTTVPYVTSITVDSDIGMVPEPGSLQLIWRNLMFLSKEPSFLSGRKACRRAILEKQSGFIAGGQITAIIGPSGAGKSTLLECLAGRRKTGLKGEVFIKYERLSRKSSNDIKISLIGQKDHAIAVLTVKEVLTFASRIKNYEKISNNYYTPRLVASVLEELNLQKCADTKVSKISGGQLKRLVFGVELISGPDIILLDEPTSGLDASSAYSCVKLLKKLTDLKRNIYNKDSFKSPAIMCSIHQPSARVMNNFHKIYVLSSDGRCIFQGPPGRLLSHLSKFDLTCPQFHNPADFIIEIASGDYGLEPINKLALFETDRQLDELNSEKIINVGSGGLAVGVRERVVYMKVSRVIQRMKNRSFPIFLHTFLLWKRTLTTNLREPKLTWLRLMQAIFIALIMSFLYDYPIGEPDGCYPRSDQAFTELRSTEDNIAFVFFITLFTVMASMMPTVLTFPSEVSILLQERNNGWYSCATYYVAKIIAEFPLQVIITSTFIAIIYPMTGQIMEWHRFGYFSLICLLISSIAQCVGILFGTYYVRSVENAVFLAPLSMAPVFLLSGFFGKLSTIPMVLKPFAYVSYVRYAFEALLVILYGFDRCSDPTSNSTAAADSGGVSASENVPSHLLNTGYVSGRDIEHANRRLRQNLSRISTYRFNPNPQDFWQEATTPISSLQRDQHSPLFDSPPGSNRDGAFVFNSSGLPNSLFADGSYVLKRFNVTEDSFYLNLAILVVFLVFLRILCYIILLKKTNQRK